MRQQIQINRRAPGQSNRSRKTSPSSLILDCVTEQSFEFKKKPLRWWWRGRWYRRQIFSACNSGVYRGAVRGALRESNPERDARAPHAEACAIRPAPGKAERMVRPDLLPSSGSMKMPPGRGVSTIKRARRDHRHQLKERLGARLICRASRRATDQRGSQHDSSFPSAQVSPAAQIQSGAIVRFPNQTETASAHGLRLGSAW